MRFASFLSVVLGLALSATAFGQSAFSARGGSPAAANARVSEPAAIPPVTVTKPGLPRTAPPSPLAPEVRVATPVAPATNPPPSRADTAPPNNNASGAAPGSAAPLGSGAAFRPGDTFILRLGGVPPEDAGSLPSEYTIGADGFVNIALAGQIRAVGLTQSQLERAIERRYIEQKIFRWPTATINVPNVSRFVTVGGAVRAPSRYPWSADMTLSSAIMTAGGKGEFASNKINLIRGGQIRRFDYKKIKARPAEDERLLPGDQVELL